MLSFRVYTQPYHLIENPIIYHLATDSDSVIETEIAINGFINLLNPNTMTRNKVIDYSDYATLKDGPFDTTDYIELETGETYDFVDMNGPLVTTKIIQTYLTGKEPSFGGPYTNTYYLAGQPYIRVSFANDAPGYNPANYAIIKRVGVNPSDFVPFGQRYRLINIPTGQYSDFRADVSIAGVLKGFMPQFHEPVHPSLLYEANFSFMIYQIRFRQNGERLSAMGIVHRGGISKSFMRYLLAEKTDIFTYKLHNRSKQFMLTTRTAGRHILVRENELCPFFFIATNCEYKLEAVNHNTVVLGQLNQGRVYALNLNHYREKLSEGRDVASVFNILVDDHVIFDITIVPSAPSPDNYIIAFSNSYGYPERLEVSGKKTANPAIADDTFERYDPDIDDYIEQNDRLSLREKITAEFGYKQQFRKKKEGIVSC